MCPPINPLQKLHLQKAEVLYDHIYYLIYNRVYLTASMEVSVYVLRTISFLFIKMKNKNSILEKEPNVLILIFFLFFYFFILFFFLLNLSITLLRFHRLSASRIFRQSSALMPWSGRMPPPQGPRDNPHHPWCSP